MSALTVYWTNNSDSLLTNAATMVANQTGAASTGVNGVTIALAASGWGEFWFRGGQPASWPNAGAMGSPTGHGAIFDSTLLDACTISAGTWTPTIRHSLTNGNANATGDIWMNFYDFDGVSAYTLIGSSTTSGATIPTATTTLTLTAGNLSAYFFAAGHKLYLDLWLHLTANANSSATAVWRLNFASSTTQGAVTDQVVCPTYFLIAPTANVVSNSLLSENAQIVASVANVISNDALVENAQIVASANVISNSAEVVNSAQIVAPVAVQANSLLSENALLITSAVLQANSVLSEVAQIVASAALIANSAISETGSILAPTNIPGTATASSAAQSVASVSEATRGNAAASIAAMGVATATDARG